ncbi:L-tryptophan decarboxylase cnsB [Trichinella spiralis]|uniref:L-tryptophan decarboxylase cnsB n=1 Tax=Trichinella spiralis TaxID=6334 RepID=A0ABR3KI85_TRISP
MPVKLLGKLSTAKKPELKLFHTGVFFDYDELGRHAAAKLPCALLHYVIDASCCTTSVVSGDAFCAAASVITSDVSFSRRKEKIVLFAVSTERGKRLAGFLLLPVSFFQY